MNALTKPIRFLLFISLAGVFLYFSRSVLIPFCIAGLLAMLFLPFASYLERKNWSRGLASFMPVALLILGAALVVGVLIWQVHDFAKDITQIEQKITGFIDDMRAKIEKDFGISQKEQEKMLKGGGGQAGGKVAGAVTGILSSLFSIGINAVLVVVYIFLFLYLRDHIKNFLLRITPEEHRNDTRSAIQKATRVSVKYLSGMAMMIALLWVLYSIGFSIVGAKYAIFFAVLCGLLEIVPFVGNITGTALTIIVNLTQGGGSNVIVGILIVYFVVQFVQSYIIEPLVVGAEVNINPLMTILALVIGETVWGIGGMILAIPLLGIVKIICDHVPALQPYGFLIGNKKKKSESGWIDKIKKKFSKNKS